jgi:hypothetical protein
VCGLWLTDVNGAQPDKSYPRSFEALTHSRKLIESSINI